MSKEFTGLNPGNQAFKQFKCPVLNVLTACNEFLQQNNSAAAHLEIKKRSERKMYVQAIRSSLSSHTYHSRRQEIHLEVYQN